MRENLRLADLGTRQVASKLMNVKVPDTVRDRINAVAAELGCSKTSLIIALINEGLDEFHTETMKEQAAVPAAADGRRGVGE